jgi:hypothetical protein
LLSLVTLKGAGVDTSIADDGAATLAFFFFFFFLSSPLPIISTVLLAQAEPSPLSLCHNICVDVDVSNLKFDLVDCNQVRGFECIKENALQFVEIDRIMRLKANASFRFLPLKFEGISVVRA